MSIEVTQRDAMRAGINLTGMSDSEMLDWLEAQAKQSPTGISFDWVPSVEGEPSGFRFMRRFFIGDAENTLRGAVKRACAQMHAVTHEIRKADDAQ